MKLSDHFSSVKQDADFETLGLINTTPSKQMLTFCANSKYLSRLLRNESVTAVICSEDLVEEISSSSSVGIVASSAPQKDFYELHKQLSCKAEYVGLSFSSTIAKSSSLHETCSISPQNVRIGEDVIIEEGVRILENVTIGHGCVIRANTVLGATGLQFYKAGKQYEGVEHLGHLYIGNDVEIQSQCEIQKGIFPWQSTIVNDGVKIGGLTCVGHASKIGKNTLIANGTMVAGSVKIGDDVWIGNNATVSNQVVIGDCARISIGSVVLSNVDKNQTVSGNPAIDHSVYLENQLELMRQVRKKRKLRL